VGVRTYKVVWGDNRSHGAKRTESGKTYMQHKGILFFLSAATRRYRMIESDESESNRFDHSPSGGSVSHDLLSWAAFKSKTAGRT
jgi:hypothetical protein